MKILLCSSLLIAVLTGLPARAQDDIVIVLDRSKSMLEKEPGNPAAGYHSTPMAARKSQEAIRSIDAAVSNTIDLGDYFALITFGNGTDLFLAQALNHVHEREIMARQLGDLVFEDGKTDIVAGLKAGADLLASLGHPERRKILVLITDGENDPPARSPYAAAAVQAKVLAELGTRSRDNNWNVSLIGLGGQTGVARIEQGLGLKNRTFVLNDERPGEIERKLGEIFFKGKTRRVELVEKELKLRLSPGLFGGYRPQRSAMTLVSHFSAPVEVSLQTLTPLVFPGGEALSAQVSPVQLTLPPGQPQRVDLTLGFQGERPADGLLRDRFLFQFAEGSQPFYPFAGPIEVVLPSWWEVYGTWATAGMAALAALLLAGWRGYRKSQTPELRVAVTANAKPLGEPMTLRIKDTFEVANGQIASRGVPAPGLGCNVAATVRYLGNRKFEVAAKEATIVNGSKPTSRLTVAMDEPFDLRDEAGKILRGLTITDARSADDFGASHDPDPF